MKTKAYGEFLLPRATILREFLDRTLDSLRLRLARNKYVVSDRDCQYIPFGAAWATGQSSFTAQSGNLAISGKSNRLASIPPLTYLFFSNIYISHLVLFIEVVGL